MNRALRAALVGLCAACAFGARADAPRPLPAQGVLQAAFAPWDDIEALLEDSVASARERVLVQAYLLTSRKLAAALLAAHGRGVLVEVMVDGRQLDEVPSSIAPALARAGIPVWIETGYQNAHNKVLVIDPATPAATVITGSFNFTWTAQHRNAENVLIARQNPPLAARYVDNWERHRRAAIRYSK